MAGIITTPKQMGIDRRTILTPKDGWKEETYYICEVAFSNINVVHRMIFYTGFLNGGTTGDQPGGYSGFMQVINGGDDHLVMLNEAFYLNPIMEMFDEEYNILSNPVTTERKQVT